MVFSSRKIIGIRKLHYFLEGGWGVIVSVGWKVGSEVSGAWCCYWDVEGWNNTGSVVTRSRKQPWHRKDIILYIPNYVPLNLTSCNAWQMCRIIQPHMVYVSACVRVCAPSIYIFTLSHEERLRWSRCSVLAFSTQVRGFKPSRSRRIFRTKKSSTSLPPEGK
jgi:hypothetical protein